MQRNSTVSSVRLALAMFALALLLGAMSVAAARVDRNVDGWGKPRLPLVLHVDDDAPPGGDGSSWRTPMRFLQDALAIANVPASGVTEIRIAQGTYKPDQGAAQTPGDRHATFLILSGLALRGGYAGSISDDPAARDWDKYQTIFSGDLLGNDGPGPWQNYGENSVLIVRAVSETGPCELEGVTITAGTTGFNISPPNVGDTQYGAGMRCERGVHIIRHCRFNHNICSDQGGGLMFFNFDDVTVRHCSFLGNTTGSGGGAIYASCHPPHQPGDVGISDCTFQNNRADDGGAVYLSTINSLELEGSVFLYNQAINDGGAIHTGNSGAPVTISRTRFEGGFVQNDGGAVYRHGHFFECDFVDNRATVFGGAVRILANVSGEGHFVGCRFINNATYIAGGTALAGGSVTCLNSEFRGNHNIWTFDLGGAFRTGGTALLANCIFDGNQSTWPGPAAVQIFGNGHATFVNCTLAQNGGNTPIGGISATGTAELRNCVVWGNVGAQQQGNVFASNSCIQDGWPGKGNIDGDPLFVDPLGPDGIPGTDDDDLRLSEGSPCIDAGDNTALPPDEFDLNGNGDTAEPLPVDLDGETRVINDCRTTNTGFPPGLPHASMVDIGTYEYQPPSLLGDVAPSPGGDGFVNVNDLLFVINSWGACPAGSSEGQATCPADIAPQGGDGLVNHLDLTAVILSWGCY